MRELKRILLPLILLFLFLGLLGRLGGNIGDFVIVIRKIALFSIAVFLTHIFRKVIFFYVDIERLQRLRSEKKIDSTEFLAICILIGLFYLGCLIAFGLML